MKAFSHLFCPLVVLFSLVSLCACSTAGKPKTFPDLDSPVPGWSYRRSIVSQSDLAVSQFNQGMLFLYGFNADEANRSFESCTRVDSTSGLCYWGIALALRAHVDHPDDDASKESVENLNKAQKFARTDADKELTSALQESYPPGRALDEGNRAYADAMRKVYQKYPNDPDIGALFVNALMNLSANGCHSLVKYPAWDTPEIREVLDHVLKIAPMHPGANHYAIHSAEVSEHPERALKSAEVLPLIAPGIAHFVHVPSHIFIRLGRYHDAVIANQKAIAVDEKYLSHSPDQGEYFESFYLHNFYFLWVSAQLGGQQKLARETSEKLVNLFRSQGSSKHVGISDLYEVTPQLTQIRFSLWNDTLSSEAPKSGRPYPMLIWHLARGMANLARNQIGLAKVEVQAMKPLLEILSKSEDKIIAQAGEIANSLLNAEIEARTGNWTGAETLYKKGITLEDELTYTEPPVWSLPVRYFYGRTLFKMKKYAEAVETSRENLKHYPNHGFTLHLLSKSLRKESRIREAIAVEKDFWTAWKYSDTVLELN